MSDDTYWRIFTPQTAAALALLGILSATWLIIARRRWTTA